MLYHINNVNLTDSFGSILLSCIKKQQQPNDFFKLYFYETVEFMKFSNSHIIKNITQSNFILYLEIVSSAYNTNACICVFRIIILVNNF